MSVAIIDSGVANLASVMAALSRLGIAAEVTSDIQKIKAAKHVILPGVGAAASAMTQLHTKKLVDTIRGLSQPVLGICLGMQLLFTRSEEGQGCACLDIIPGDVQGMKASVTMPVPHMGWNQISLRKISHPLVQGIEDDGFAYFVHSYAVSQGPYTVATCAYTETFSAIVTHKNFFACQFHPERSGELGAQILKNFLSL